MQRGYPAKKQGPPKLTYGQPAPLGEEDVEPAGHENPAAQGPVQEDDAMAAVAP